VFWAVIAPPERGDDGDGSTVLGAAAGGDILDILLSTTRIFDIL